jgi:DNA (cytosine-5)-methyltransferase 1
MIRICCASRGRDPSNPSDRTSGNPNLEQRLELNSNGLCNCLTSVYKDSMVLEGNMIDTSSDFGVAKYEYKIRKLTPRETWRLMGFSDEDFEKAAAVNSQTQLYKQSGNSIVEDVLMALFSQLNIQGVIPWNEVN